MAMMAGNGQYERGHCSTQAILAARSTLLREIDANCVEDETSLCDYFGLAIYKRDHVPAPLFVLFALANSAVKSLFCLRNQQVNTSTFSPPQKM